MMFSCKYCTFRHFYILRRKYEYISTEYTQLDILRYQGFTLKPMSAFSTCTGDVFLLKSFTSHYDLDTWTGALKCYLNAVYQMVMVTTINQLRFV